MKIPSFNLRPTLTILQDEETVNFRSSNLLSGPLYLRAFSVPEASHPAWNDSSRAMLSSGIKASVLKATILVNHFRGPYRSGRFGFELSEAALAFLRTISDEELEAKYSEEFAFDTKNPTAVLTKEAFLQSPGICNRLPSAIWHGLVSLCLQFKCQENVLDSWWFARFQIHCGSQAPFERYINTCRASPEFNCRILIYFCS